MGTTRLVAAGDAILTRQVYPITQTAFLSVVDLLLSADVAYTNLEMVFPGPGRRPGATYHGTHLGVDPDLLDEFTWMGVDLYGLSNTHSTHYGTDALDASMAQLRARGMTFAGVGRTLREARRPVYFQAP